MSHFSVLEPDGLGGFVYAHDLSLGPGRICGLPEIVSAVFLGGHQVFFQGAEFDPVRRVAVIAFQEIDGIPRDLVWQLFLGGAAHLVLARLRQGGPVRFGRDFLCLSRARRDVSFQ